MSVKKNYLYQSAYQLLLILVPLLTTPYLSRVLGPSQIGVFSYTQSVSSYFVMFATLGMSTYGVREIASCANNREKRSNTFSELFIVQLLVGILASLAYIVYCVLITEMDMRLVLVWAMWVLSAPLDISWLFFGVEDFKFPTIRAAATKILCMVAIFVLVKRPEDLWIYCASISSSFLINQILLWPFITKYVDIVPPNPKRALVHLRPNIKLFIPVVAISFYTTLDKVMLGAMSNMTQVGYFEYSEKLSRMPMALITAMGTVMLPRMTLELRSGNNAKALRMLESSIWVMLALAFAIMFGIIGISKEFAPVFLGAEFTTCAPIMCVLALIIPVVSITNVIGRQYLLPSGRDNTFTLSVCVGAAVNIGLNYLLIPRWGAMGSAVSTVGAELSVWLVQMSVTRQELPMLRYIARSIPFAICGAIMLFGIRLASDIAVKAMGVGVMLLLLEVATGVVLYSMLAFAWIVLSGKRRILSKHESL